MSGKWLGIPIARVDQALEEDLSQDHRHYWVIEGDGARERRLKCWASHEPQIPRLTESAVLVIDGQLWGTTLQEKDIHRSERCPSLIGRTWSPELAWEYILSSPVFKTEYREMSWAVFFNSWSNSEKELKHNNFSKEIGALLKLKEKYLLQAQLLKSELPRHLRLASGDAKEGNLQWFDLW